MKIIILIMSLVFASTSQAAIIWSENFESGTIKNGELMSCADNSNAARVKSNTVRSGKYSGYFRKNANEGVRCEVVIGRGNRTGNSAIGDFIWGAEYWQSFSFNIESHTAGFFSIIQHHSAGRPGDPYCPMTGGNGFSVMKNKSGKGIDISLVPSKNLNSKGWGGAGIHSETAYTIPYQENKWFDIVMNFKYSDKPDGFWKVWVNGEQVINRTGSNVNLWTTDRSYIPKTHPRYNEAALNNCTGRPKARKYNGTYGVYTGGAGAGAAYYDELKIGDKNNTYDTMKPAGSARQEPPIPTEQPGNEEETGGSDTPTEEQWSILDVGGKMFIDRDYLYSSGDIPDEYIGFKQFLTRKNNSGAASGWTTGFQLESSQTVYVAHSDVIEEKPDWLISWANTGKKILPGKSAQRSVYKKIFSANSDVVLGENRKISNGIGSMYMVFVGPVEETVTPPPVTPPTTPETPAPSIRSVENITQNGHHYQRVLLQGALPLNISIWEISRTTEFNQKLLRKRLHHRDALIIPLGVLQAENSYWVRVRYVDRDGNLQPWSTPFQFTTPIDANDTDKNAIDDRYQVDTAIDIFDNGKLLDPTTLCHLYDAQTNGVVGFSTDTGEISCYSAYNKPHLIEITDRILPYGLFNFKISPLTIDRDNPAQVEVMIYFPSALEAEMQWLRFDESQSAFSNASTGTQMESNRVTLRLIDGGENDADGEVNGVIVNTSGPSPKMNLQTLNDTLLIDDNGGGIGALGLSLIGLILLFRWHYFSRALARRQDKMGSDSN